MNSDALMVLQPCASRRSRRPHLERRVEAVRAPCELFVTDDIAARERDLFRAAQVQRNSLAPGRRRHRLVVNLKAANAEQLVSRKRADLVAEAEFAALRG